MDELGIPWADREIFRAVERKLSYGIAAEHLGLPEDRLKRQFYLTCLKLQKHPKGRALVQQVMEQITAALNR